MAQRRIYLSELESMEEQTRQMERYGVGLESFEFSLEYNLCDLPKRLKWFTENFPWNSRGGLSLHGPFLDLNAAAFDSGIRRVTMERYQQCYAAAKALKAERIVYHSCYYPANYWPENWAERSVAFWKEFLQDKDDSILIHMENLYDPEYRYMAQVMEEVGHPAFSLCLDIAHANIFSAVPVMEWLENLQGKIGHFHLSNNDGSKDQHHALDAGTLDIKAIAAAIGRWYPGVSCTLEIIDPREAEHSLQLLPRLLDLT